MRHFLQIQGRVRGWGGMSDVESGILVEMYESVHCVK